MNITPQTANDFKSFKILHNADKDFLDLNDWSVHVDTENLYIIYIPRKKSSDIRQIELAIPKKIFDRAILSDAVGFYDKGWNISVDQGSLNIICANSQLVSLVVPKNITKRIVEWYTSDPTKGE